MSGHSKWHNIQVRKGKQDAKKANVFTKCAKLITVAAERGADPAMNFALRLAIDKAKAAGMPKDNIERAIKRGSGDLAGITKMEEFVYEAFGPGGVAILIKVLTDNKNRTSAELKHILIAHDGSLAGPGSVQWMFEQAGVVVISKETIVNREEAELGLIEAGAEDIRDTEDGIEIKTKLENLQKVEQKAKELGLEVKNSEIRWIAKDHLEPPKEHEDKLADLFAELEAHDDVEDYYTNAE